MLLEKPRAPTRVYRSTSSMFFTHRPNTIQFTLPSFSRIDGRKPGRQPVGAIPSTNLETNGIDSLSLSLSAGGSPCHLAHNTRLPLRERIMKRFPRYANNNSRLREPSLLTRQRISILLIFILDSKYIYIYIFLSKKKEIEKHLSYYYTFFCHGERDHRILPKNPYLRNATRVK